MNNDFLTTAQSTKNLRVDIARKPLIKDFTTLMAGFGSCFAQNIQGFMTPFGFRFWWDRPVGGHYSPESMANMLELVAQERPRSDEELYEFQDELGGLAAYQFFFKKRFFGPEARALAFAAMDEMVVKCRKMVRACGHAVVTLGTPRIIRLNRNGVLINAASGIPVEDYYSEMTSVDENLRHLERIHDGFAAIRGEAPTIFLTISPQRYLFSQGVPGCEDVSPVVDNMLGKSNLRAAIEMFVQNHPDTVVYFPSFEIVLDELRHFESLSGYDYVHINQDLTPKYVVKRFMQSYCTDDVLAQLPLAEKAGGLAGRVSTLVSGGLAPDNPLLLREVDAFTGHCLETAPAPALSRAIVRQLISMLHGQGRHERVVEFFGTDIPHPYTMYDVAVSLVELGRTGEAADLCRAALAHMDETGYEYPALRNCVGVLSASLS